MAASTAVLEGSDQPRIVHETAGRVRVHAPDWSGADRYQLENRLRRARGIVAARADSFTSNIVIRFDPRLTSAGDVLDSVASVLKAKLPHSQSHVRPHAIHERSGNVGRSRIAVPGLDRHPERVRQVVDHYGRLPGVRRVVASALTGRLLVEYSRDQVQVEDLVSHLADLELPDVGEGDQPQDPLDPGPLVHSLIRTIGAGLGLTLLAAGKVSGLEVTPGVRSRATQTAALIGVAQSFPGVRHLLQRLVGRTGADLAFYLPGIAVLTLSGSPLGLAVAGAESLRVLTEVLPRRAAWRRYEAGLESLADAHPDDRARVESGESIPLPATVVEGFGTAIGRDGKGIALEPGANVPAGSRCYGGPFVVHLLGGRPFIEHARPAPVAPSLYDRYLLAVSPASLGVAAITLVLTRSLSRGFQALLLVNARPAMIGRESADTSASARVLRAGVTVVGTRPERIVRRPDTLLLDGVRTLLDGVEISRVLTLEQPHTASDIEELAGAVAAAAGGPWGNAVARAGSVACTEGRFDGRTAGALAGDTRYALGPPDSSDTLPAELSQIPAGDQILVLRADPGPPLGAVVLRPKLAHGVKDLVATCAREGVTLEAVNAGDAAASASICHRAGVLLSPEKDCVSAVRRRQADGQVVAVVSDSTAAAEAFAASDLAIGLTTGRTSHFPARADLLAPDLSAVTAIVEAGSRREVAVRDSVVISGLSNVVGVVWGFREEPGLARAAYGVYIAALAAGADVWIRLRGGERARSTVARLVDPRPERWGRRSVDAVLRTFNSSPGGLSDEQAAERRTSHRKLSAGGGVPQAVLDQIRSPLIGILAIGAGLSFVLGSIGDVAIIAATISANVLSGAWQERQAGQAVSALERIGASTCRVLRGGQEREIAATEVVPGDILVLAPGERVAADARVISARGLEVDEAALTGESFPVSKAPEGGIDASRIVLAGSDVTVGTGLALVVAVGQNTRMGAMAAALALDEMRSSPLGIRLNHMLRQVMPVIVAGGGLVLVSGALRRRSLVSQLAIAASVAIAAVPEGLPLLAGIGEVAVARRLAGRNALVRRLSAIEALGRVDVACTDKTGTLTEGRLALTCVAGLAHDGRPGPNLPLDLRRVLRSGGLATPHPEAADALSHPTDVAVMEGVRAAGMGKELLQPREAELSFDPLRSFHAALSGGSVHLKGAVETLAPRCTRVLRGGHEEALDESGRDELVKRAEDLASRGMRVLMVAEGPSDVTLDDPGGLLALGYLGLTDPLRPSVRGAVRRCHEAGVRVMMLTGDHPVTAGAIGREAGLLRPGDLVLSGADIAALDEEELGRRLEHTTVVARVTPLDKLRIVESLQRRHHTVAMTGDGVNDAPALRLADVGVAMGLKGTEVARQAADVVLADDNFSTMVEALVEGRSFWRNIRRALGLLLGGNLGELGLIVGGSLLGTAAPMASRQILVVNMLTDVFPSLAVTLQPPETRRLDSLAREGTTALGAPLWRDISRRGVATAGPSLAAFLLALRSGDVAYAQSVAFASLVGTQLAQTLQMGQTEGSLTRSVFAAVGGSSTVLAAAFLIPQVRGFLGLVLLGPSGVVLVSAASVAAGLLGGSRLRPANETPRPRLLPAPA
ncbi:MAG TPA: HAD-IC family P-type ATPase [Chloroflexota bacterium]|nr:HAD-IC family P-type ATPase [Chloroflexota bacterium]